MGGTPSPLAEKIRYLVFDGAPYVTMYFIKSYHLRFLSPIILTSSKLWLPCHTNRPKYDKPQSF